MLSVLKDVNQISHRYSPNGEYIIRIEDSLSSLSVVHETENKTLMNSIVEIPSLGDNIVKLESKCFQNCNNLSVANGTSYLKEIGASCFINCTKLQKSNLFDGSIEEPINIIADSAFRNTGFTEVKINLFGGAQNDESNMGDYAFAGCSSLQKVSFTKSNYIGQYGFASCDNLNEINFANRYSYMEENCFDSCSSLQSVNIPQKFHMITDQMFNHCHNLKSLEFNDPVDEPSHLGALGASCFNDCPNLTSITLPSSINSLFFLDDNAFYGSSLKRVKFNGLDDSVFGISKSQSITTTYKTGKWYGGYITNDQYDSEVKSAQTILTQLADGIDNTPVICLKTNPKGCDRCIKQEEKVWSTTKFKEYQANSNAYWIHQFTKTGDNVAQKFSDNITKFLKSIKFKKQYSAFPNISIYYRDPSDNNIKNFEIDGETNKKYNDVDYIIENISKIVTTYSTENQNNVQNSNTTITLSRAVTGWGLSNDCIFISKDGTEYEWKYDPENENNTITYIPSEKIDEVTTDNFKYGIWYYNIDKLVPFADRNNIPVFIEIGSVQGGCGPCVQFNNSIFKNKQFQDMIKKYPCLLGHVDYDMTNDPQVQYAEDNLYNSSTNKYGPPHIIFHWRKTDGSVINIDKHFDQTDIYPEQIEDLDGLKTYLDLYFNGAVIKPNLTIPTMNVINQKYSISNDSDIVQLTSDTSFSSTNRISTLSSTYKAKRPYYKALYKSSMTSIATSVGGADVSVHCECKDPLIQVNGLSVTYIDILGKKVSTSSITDYSHIRPLSSNVCYIDNNVKSYDVPRIKYYIEKTTDNPNFIQDMSGIYFICDSKQVDKTTSYQISTYNSSTSSFNDVVEISYMKQTGQPLDSSIYPYKKGWYQYYTTAINEPFYDKEGIIFKTDNITLTTQLTSDDFTYSDGETINKLSSDPATSAIYSTLSTAKLKSTTTYTDEDVEINALDYNQFRIYTCDGQTSVGGKSISNIKIWLSGDIVIHAKCYNETTEPGISQLYKFTNNSK